MTRVPIRPPDPTPPPATRQMRDALRRFIESAPLYKKVQMELPVEPAAMIPDAVESYCPNCKQLRVFSAEFYSHREERARMGLIVNSDRIQPPKEQWPGRWKLSAMSNSGIYMFVGLCSFCRQFTFTCFLLLKPVEQWVQKVGQNPAPWFKPTRPEIKASLGADYSLYQRAIALIGEGFGMGACAYLRRLIENQIDPLLDKLRAIEEAAGASTERLTEIDALRDSRDFAAKARAVLNVVPDALKVPGHNPLITLHSGYSAGMHGWSEEDCLAVAELSVEALGHMIVHLVERPQQHRDYVERLKAVDRKRADAGC